MTEYSFDEDIIFHLYEDAYGFRPREMFWSEWNNASDDEKQEIWDDLCKALERAIQEEKEQEEFAVIQFNDRVAKVIATGASDRETAIRWIVQSMGLDENDLMYGGSYVCWNLGLPYSMQTEFDGICNRMLANLREQEEV
jgi:hypothetical protein